MPARGPRVSPPKSLALGAILTSHISLPDAFLTRLMLLLLGLQCVFASITRTTQLEVVLFLHFLYCPAL